MKWEWRPESIESTMVQGKGDFSINKIVDQKDMANDAIEAPIELVIKNGNQTIVKSLTSNKWSYKIGMDGIANKFFEMDCNSTLKWASDSIPVYRNFTWYKTTFKAPLGNNPIVVDLIGLGKGIAWVNVHDIGRYWPSAVADEDMCEPGTCDYRGQYNDQSISKIEFASFGTPRGECGSFDKSEYESDEDVISIIKQKCVGKEPCCFDVSKDRFGKPPCTQRRLAEEALCS
ncbi:hypothetical protein Gotri_020037 [Gossypium trilobum]|uniref:SUEL-type lectin domain-containing protein n=1 Tax=Gossypium trilobum TaxID=34281 RepID=A0A7J9D847_9ROSI|nr:hypothetical protein [Gossypium trilobum]